MPSRQMKQACLRVALFTGLWTVLLAMSLLDTGRRWLGFAGLAAAVLLLMTLVSLFGIEMPALLTISGLAWQFFAAALAITLLRRG